ncbi:phage adaptor protein [Sphingobium sp. CCH11-B1]|jgi:hypothetical protein|uniref:phage adaptor protein n=1 Tax=Sphingobium sp. CCH11-B1 TaxID=1768781 RepID=UPI00082BBDA4|nr:hypothetical protein [Sphingobium sp. CCH11-B1]
MNFGDCKARLRALINRRDLTDQLAGSFITDAVADMEREVRIGPMELVLSQSEWDGEKNAMFVPRNFLETINIFTDQQELDQADISNFLKVPDIGGVPTHFVKVSNRWLLRPTPAPGTRVYLHYYSQSEALLNDDDENTWTRAAPNAVVYTAAGLAADFFQMEDNHAQRYAARARGYIEALEDQNINEKWGGRITIPMPAGTGDF